MNGRSLLENHLHSIDTILNDNFSSMILFSLRTLQLPYSFHLANDKSIDIYYTLAFEDIMWYWWAQIDSYTRRQERTNGHAHTINMAVFIQYCHFPYYCIYGAMVGKEEKKEDSKSYACINCVYAIAIHVFITFMCT